MQTTATFGKRIAAPGAPLHSRRPPLPKPPPGKPPQPGSAVNEFLAAKVAALPWFTCAWLLVLVGIYLVETLISALAGHPLQPSHSVLLKLGGSSGHLTLGALQIWRALTAPLLHANWAHLIGNAVAFALVGLLLEPIVGWRWFAAIYMLGGLGGSLGSLLLNPASVNSVGASGAIMGVLSCALVLSFHIACFERRKRMRWLSLRVGVPALAPLGAMAGHTDYSAHLGGAIAGILLGYTLQIIWDEDRPVPPFGAHAGYFAGVVGALSLLAFGFAAVLPTSAPIEVHTAGLIPIDDLPSSSLDALARASDLELRYPNDPRAHLFMANRWIKSGNDPEATAEMERALQSPFLKAPEIGDDLEAQIRVALAMVYLKDDRSDDARIVVEPLCKRIDQLPLRAAQAIGSDHLCAVVGPNM